MFSTFKILVIYLIISSRCTCIPTSNGKTTTLSFEEKVKNELEPLKDHLDKIVNPLTNNDEKVKLKGVVKGKMEKIIERAVGAETENKVLIKDLRALEIRKELADEWAWFELMRQQIEYYDESNFPQPYDDDFESKKISWNKERLKGKSDHELHEERRYQKFKYYLEHPPNEELQKLRNRLHRANVTVEVFSRGVAKAYRLLLIMLGISFKNFLSDND